jgi:ribosomal protein L20
MRVDALGNGCFAKSKGTTGSAANSSKWRPRRYTAPGHLRPAIVEYRALWIIRITAACRARGMSYSRFINGLTRANVGLNRKSLSELAIHSPHVFDQLVDIARTAVSSAKA